MEKIRIDILGQEYTVISDESPKYIRSLAKRLSNHIAAITESGANVPQNAAMALVAISYLDEIEKNAAQIEELKASNVALTNKIQSLSAELEASASKEEKKEADTSASKDEHLPFDGAQLKLL